jgi:hypothetical protein
MYAGGDIGACTNLHDYPGIDIRSHNGYVVAGPSHLKEDRALKYVEGYYQDSSTLELPPLPAALASYLAQWAPATKPHGADLLSTPSDAATSPEALLGQLRIDKQKKALIRRGFKNSDDRSARTFSLLLDIIGKGHAREEYVPIFFYAPFGISEWPREAGQDNFLRYTVETAEAKIAQGKAAPWCAPYVFVKRGSTFWNRETGENDSLLSFDLAHLKDRTPAQRADKQMPSHIALQEARIPTVQDLAYRPGAGPIFTDGGVSYANTYKEWEGVLPEAYSPEEQAAIDRMQAHFAAMIPEEGPRNVLLDFLALQVQHPERRLDFAFFIHGPEGCGKSYVVHLMKAVLGAGAVTAPKGQVLRERFTDWCCNTQLCIFEEIKIDGPDKHAVFNDFKPYVTNPYVTLRPFAGKQREVVNVVSYGAVSNFSNGVPIEEGDTRWYPIKAVSTDATKADFQALYELTTEYAGAFRKHLLERTIVAIKGSRAPACDYKAELATQNQESLRDHFENVLLDRGQGIGQNAELLSLPWILREWTMVANGPETPLRQALVAKLAYWGWEKVPLFDEKGLRIPQDRVRVKTDTDGDNRHAFYTRDLAALKKRFPGLKAADIRDVVSPTFALPSAPDERYRRGFDAEAEGLPATGLPFQFHTTH